MSGFSETAVEDTPLEWLASLGYDVPYGPQIVAGILPAQVTGTIWAVPSIPFRTRPRPAQGNEE